MKRRIANIIESLMRRIEERVTYRRTKVYGIFPPDMKTTFRRDQV
jgi:hypothetical protein